MKHIVLTLDNRRGRFLVSSHPLEITEDGSHGLCLVNGQLVKESFEQILVLLGLKQELASTEEDCGACEGIGTIHNCGR